MGGDVERRRDAGTPQYDGLLQWLQTKAPEGCQIHVHHHYAPPAPPPAEVRADITTRMAPWFVLLLGGCVILALLAVVFSMLATAFAALMMSLAIGLGALAVCAVAVAAATRSLRLSRAEEKILKRGMK